MSSGGAGTNSQNNMNNIAEILRTDFSLRQSFLNIVAQRDTALGQQLTQSLRLLDTAGPQGQSGATLDNEDKEAIQRITDLGFDKKQALAAYLASNKNEERATNSLENNKSDNNKDAKAIKPPPIGRLIYDNLPLRLGLNEFIAQKDSALAQQIKDNPALFEAALRRVGEDPAELDPSVDWKAEIEKAKAEAASWKSNYDTLKANYDSLTASHQAVTNLGNWKSEYDALKAKYDSLVASNQAATNTAVNSAFDYALKSYSIRANYRYSGYTIYDASWPDWLGYEVGEVLYTSGYTVPSKWGNLYRACNSAGRVGVVHASYFSFV